MHGIVHDVEVMVRRGFVLRKYADGAPTNWTNLGTLLHPEPWIHDPISGGTYWEKAGHLSGDCQELDPPPVTLRSITDGDLNREAAKLKQWLVDVGAVIGWLTPPIRNLLTIQDIRATSNARHKARAGEWEVTGNDADDYRGTYDPVRVAWLESGIRDGSISARRDPNESPPVGARRLTADALNCLRDKVVREGRRFGTQEIGNDFALASECEAHVFLSRILSDGEDGETTNELRTADERFYSADTLEDPEKRLMSKRAAELLGISPQSMSRLSWKPAFRRTRKEGRNVWIHPDDLLTYAAARGLRFPSDSKAEFPARYCERYTWLFTDDG